MHRFPSEEWAEAYKNALNHSKAYREACREWTFGNVAIIVQCDLSIGIEHDVGIIVDVHRGECRGAKFVECAGAPIDAGFVIAGSYQRWKDVIERGLDPIKALMEGKLKLRKGHLPTMIRFVESSRQLVATAARVPTEFLH